MEKTFFGQSCRQDPADSLEIPLVHLLNLSTELKKRLGGNCKDGIYVIQNEFVVAGFSLRGETKKWEKSTTQFS
jgi:hypothetical protein